MCVCARAPANDVYVTWTVTEIVQDWLCGAANYGFIVIFPTGEAANEARYGQFDTLEQNAGSPFEKPVLVVDFGPPGACPAVGGVVMPANTLAIAAPWLAVIGLVGGIGTVVGVAKERRP